MQSRSQAERLHKILSRAGIASRRTAETLIQTGRVQVNGKIVTRLGTTVDPRHDRILFDGQPIVLSVRPLYFLLNKPPHVVSTLKDPQGRTTARDLLRDVRARVFPVGRLDYDSAGLLIFTNDGDLTERLLHPRSQIPRTYHAKVQGTPTPEALRELRRGVQLDDGTLSAPAKVHVLRGGEKHTWLELTLREGRNREVRRMCEAVGHPVEKLIRVRFGPLLLRNLSTGAYRSLTSVEVRTLRRLAGLPAESRP